MKRMTDAQRAAALTWDRNVGVSAGAGSGKTSVMVERAVGLITHGADIREMLMMTFTVNATEGIRSRIREALAEAVAKKPDNRLRRQISAIGSAGISTIHAFCLDLVREFFHAAGVDPMFSLVGEIQRAMLSTRVMETLMEDRFSTGDQGFYDLVDRCGGERALAQLIQRVDQTAQTLPDREGFYARLTQPYADAAWLAEYAQEARERLHCELLLPVEEAVRAVEEGAPGAEKYLGELRGCVLGVREALTLEPGPQALAALHALVFPRITPLNREEPELRDYVKERVDAAKAAIAWAGKGPVYLRSPEENRAALRELLPQADLLRELALEYRRLLDQEKSALRLLEFSDVEHLALRVLRDPLVQEELGHRYKYVFVDEYQDVSPLQQAVIDLLPGNQFFVGDIKQSIYGFRDAEPTLFLRRFEDYREREDCLAVQLQHNFRSSPAILEAVNAVFDRCMTPELGRVDYQKEHRLIPGRQGERGERPRLLLVPDLREEELTNAAAQALVMAREMERLRGEGYRYGDMVILLRSIGDRAGEIQRVLSAAGIPAVTPPMAGYFGTPSMEALLGLLRYVDNPLDDTALLAALALWGLSADDLAAIRLSCREGAYHEALSAYQTPGPLLEAVTDFRRRMAEYRRYAAVYGVERLVARIKGELAGPLDLYSLKEDNLSPLAAVLAYAREFDQRGGGNLYEFLKVLDRVREDSHAGREMPIAPSAAGDAVRIMTVHGSKGLEFPVVFFAAAESRFNTADLRGVPVDRDLGVALPLLREGEREDGPLREPMGSAIRRRNLEEEMRILYVALTRGERELLVVATADGETAPPAAQSARCPLDWILPAAEAFAVERLTEVPRLRAAQRPTFARLAQEADPREMEELAHRLDYRYPYEDQVKQPQRAAPSAVGTAPEERLELVRPRFVGEEEGFTGAERGTIVHKAMMLLDLSAIATAGDLAAQLEGLVRRELLTQREAEALDPAMILGFVKSPVYARVASSPRVYRELPFNLVVPARELLMEGDGEVMVQGIVDCAFVEDGRLIILDYKTDYVRPGGGILALQERYRHQMRIYRRAMERTMGLRVGEVILFLLRTGEALTMPLEEDM